jgi:hypothetical protein
LILFGLNDGLLEQENLVQYCMLKAFIRLSESLEPIDFKILCNQNGTWSQQMIVKIIEKSFVTLMSDFQFSAGTLKLYRFWIDILIKNKAMMVSELFIRQMLKDIVQGLKSHSQPRYLKVSFFD